MTTTERRSEIMRILTARRSCKIDYLANALNVSERTIRRDVAELTLDYPLETVLGRNGCVMVPDWYHPHRNVLTIEQQTVLTQLMNSANEQQREVLRQMLVEYGSPKTRQMMNGGIYAG